jgi:hypothetical protein
MRSQLRVLEKWGSKERASRRQGREREGKEGEMWEPSRDGDDELAKEPKKLEVWEWEWSGSGSGSLRPEEAQSIQDMQIRKGCAFHQRVNHESWIMDHG